MNLDNNQICFTYLGNIYILCVLIILSNDPLFICMLS